MVIMVAFTVTIVKNAKKLKDYLAEFKKMGFWTFNKHVKAWIVFDPDWSIKNRFFSMKPLSFI